MAGLKDVLAVNAIHSAHVCPHPRVVQIVVHAGDLYALNDHGEIFIRVRDSKDFNQGPNVQPVYHWRAVAGPDSVVPARDFGGPQDHHG